MSTPVGSASGLDISLRETALQLSQNVIPKEQMHTGGLYAQGIRKTAEELVEDAEVIFEYLKKGLVK